MAIGFGWLAVALILLSASLPLGFRLRAKKRASPDSKPIRTHVWLGISTSAVAFAHSVFVLPGLGSPAALEGGVGGVGALLPGVAAFFILMAHSGVGLQLRDVRLRNRPRKRRLHVATAIAIVVTVAAHVIPLAMAPP